MSFRHVTQAVFASLPALLGVAVACSADESAPDPSQEGPEALNDSPGFPSDEDARGALEEASTRFRVAGTEPVLTAGGAAQFAAGDVGFAARVPRDRSGLAVTLPADAREPVRLEAGQDLSVAFALEGATAAAPRFVDGVAVYGGAAPGGGDLFHRVGAGSVEDFLVLEERPDREVASYAVDVSRVAGLRLVAGTLEFLSADGAPQIRVNRPYLVDANGTRHEATLSVDGCAYDTSGAAPFGRPVTEPGSELCSVTVDWTAAGDVTYPALIDPAWTATGSLASARKGHTATAVTATRSDASTGTVVVVIGGEGPGSTYPTAIEVFDPTANAGAGAFATIVPSGAGDAFVPRAFHVAVGRGDDTIVIAGGEDGSGAMASAQVLSGIDGTPLITDVDPLTTARSGAKGVAIGSNRDQVIVTGGVDGTTVLDSFQILAAVGGTWSVESTMTSPRRGHVLVALGSASPQPMVIAGITTTSTVDLNTSEVYGAGSWSLLGANLATNRYFHAGAVLSDGRVLVAGGYSRGTSANTASAEVYDAFSGTWASAGTLSTARQYHTITALPGGGAVSVGGATTSNGVAVLSRVATVDLFDATTDQWAAGPQLSGGPRAFHTATLLDDGSVLVVGGENNLPTILDTAERFGLDAIGTACTTGATCGSGFCADGFCCDAACDEVCASCAATDTGGTNGTCAAVSPGTDPDGECTDSGGNTCSSNGLCSGAIGFCQTYPTTPCTARPCTLGTECTSGYCVDGVCCDSPCAGTCEACSATAKGFGLDGVCDYVDYGADPNGDCASIGTGACTGAGVCDGGGACISENAGLECAPAACADAVTLTYQALCDDQGNCGTPTSTDCGTYRCNDTTLECNTSCTTDADCNPNVTCNGGQCTPNALGSACVGGADCDSGLCIDGVCCDQSCNGQCEACDVPGSEGYCSPVVGAPRGNAAACGGTGDCAGLCDGSDRYSCTYPGSETSCGGGARSCDGTDRVVGETCDGSGSCQQQTVTFCDPFICAGGDCLTSCQNDLDCTPGSRCDASGSCVGPGQAFCAEDRYVETSGGARQDCSPYACVQGNCMNSCQSSEDCSGGNVCYTLRNECAPPRKDSGCGCRTVSGQGDAGLGWLAALGLALGWSRRRRATARR